MTQDLRGFSLLEMALAVGISGMVMAGIWQTTAGVQRQANAQQAASQLLSVAQAAQVAINNNKVAWLDTTTGPIAAINAVACIKVTAADSCATAISDLQTLGVLPATATAQNVYAHTYKFYVQRLDGGAPGADADDRIAGLVITTGGTDMDDDSGRMAAITIGAAGSYLPSDYAGTTTGTGGSWSLSLNAAPWSAVVGADAAAGHLAVFLPMLPNAPTMGASVGASASNIDELTDAITVTPDIDDGSGGFDPAYNLFLGENAGNAATAGTSAAYSSTALGYDSQSSNTSMSITSLGYKSAALTDGTADLLAIGSNTLSCATSPSSTTAIGNENGGCGGSANVAIGHNALKDYIGSYTTAVGHQAGYALSSNAFNTAIGYQSLYSSVQDASVTAVGYQSLYNHKSTNTNTVMANTGVGAYALYSHVTSNNGTSALGYGSLRNATSVDGRRTAAGYNTALGNLLYPTDALGAQAGAGAGYSSTAGYRAGVSLINNITTTGNVVVGSISLESNIAGQGNTAVGYAALNKSTGNANTAFGSEALRYNVSGTNTAFGYQAAMGNAVTAPALMTATRNSAFGYQSMLSLTSGTDNVALGYQSLMSITSGSYNAAAGYRAGMNITTGQNNIALGYYALAGIPLTPGVTTKSNNIAIGAWTMAGSGSSNRTGNNNIMLGPKNFYSSLAANTDNNIGIGAGVLSDLTSGTRNIAIGWAPQIGTKIQTGNDNILIGRVLKRSTALALSKNIFISEQSDSKVTSGDGTVCIGTNYIFDNLTSGQYNTAIGSQIGIYATTASANTAAGGYALKLIESGTYNTAIGYETLMNTKVGSFNTAIGGYRANLSLGNFNTSAGSLSLGGSPQSSYGNVTAGVNSGLNNTTGNNNIAIGYGSGPTAAALSNTISLGYNAQATASNTVQIGNASVATISGQVAWSAISDLRDKHDINDADLGENFIMALRPVSYRLKNGNGRTDFGFIAQEVEKALQGRVTNMVTRENDRRGTYRLRAADILAPIVKTVQQQDSRLQNIKQSNDRLEAEINNLKAEMAALEEMALKQNEILASHGGVQ